ncbi:hypothetical protein K432DRAFT_430499 [Lepidopterella palustris CBS 459.81]|uniref:Uncharacterized protein n=1 Tax=Lepidopterella palustris CBS 459.81 TaxID=1314670 RepID=A0A8E2DXQ0_9PEZI|nr:hypothetical protein K432DRAFT_430499 [Lepidopterella palustris CBS 459.81]
MNTQESLPHYGNISLSLANTETQRRSLSAALSSHGHSRKVKVRASVKRVVNEIAEAEVDHPEDPDVNSFIHSTDGPSNVHFTAIDLSKDAYETVAAPDEYRDIATLHYGLDFKLNPPAPPSGTEEVTNRWRNFGQTTEHRDRDAEFKGSLHDGQLQRANRLMRQGVTLQYAENEPVAPRAAPEVPVRAPASRPVAGLAAASCAPEGWNEAMLWKRPVSVVKEAIFETPAVVRVETVEPGTKLGGLGVSKWAL